MTETELTDLKDRLNSVSDRLNLLITQEEAYLHALGLGVQTFIKIDNESGSKVRLGYSKLNGAWKIVLREYENEIQYEDRPLDRVARGIRFHIAKRLPELRAAVIQNAKELADKIEKFLIETENTSEEVKDESDAEIRRIL